MAKVVKEEPQSQQVAILYPVWKIALIGAGLGAIYWALTALISKYIIDPLFCRSVTDAAVCVNSTSVSGDIATVLVATLGIVVLLRLRVAQPLITAVASAVALWGLARWTDGLAWAEIVLWSAVLYALAYTLFSWIARYSRVAYVLIATILVIIIVRIVVMS
ncbi:MAG TPA: hypothetical protein VFS65_00795 [Candidatus Saccharimonadales bacterium]|nr:hypothetical protein [Candidatus Saccharimonadales bacterium]